MKKVIFISLFLGLFHLGQAQDVHFTTKVSKSVLGLNQRFKIEFIIDKNGADNFQAPDFTRFKVIAGPSSSVSQSWINGKSTYSQSYIYMLQPKAKGQFTIPPAKIEYKGKTLQSNPVKITVTDKVALPKNPDDPEYIAHDNIFLVASVSKTRPYVGESIYVEYRLYFSDKIGFGNVEFGENPKYQGFWNQEINVKQQEKEGTLNGKSMRYYTLKKMLLIPQKSGKLYIDPMEMDMTVSVPTGRRDFFGTPLTRRLNAHYQSTRKVVNVKPLPQKGKPENFTGAVGDFNLDVRVSKPVLKAGESTQVWVEVSGKGNLKLFDLPQLVVPSNLEVYTPEHNQKVQTTYSGLKGSISDNYSIVPEYKGKYKIPPLQFSYFNPKDQQYHRLQSPELIIEVTEGKTAVSTDNDSFTEKQRVKSLGGDFRFIRTKAALKPKKSNAFYGSKWYYFLLLLPFISIPAGVWIGRKKKAYLADVTGAKQRTADRLARKYLSKAKKQLKNKEAFYVALEKALHNFLKAKLHIETSDMSQEKISSLLESQGVSSTFITSLLEVLDDCNLARYASSASKEPKTVYEKAVRVISGINAEIK